LMSVFDPSRDGERLAVDFDWDKQSVVLVALRDDVPVGVLKMVVHPIGADNSTGPYRNGDAILTEGKVLEFGVRQDARRQGIGTALQHAAITRARQLGCYQLRSHSGGDRAENHALKIALGFAIDPIVRGDDRRGAYFILPLRREA
jgi:GNAT superfamily N-acetyltransferase